MSNIPTSVVSCICACMRIFACVCSERGGSEEGFLVHWPSSTFFSWFKAKGALETHSGSQQAQHFVLVSCVLYLVSLCKLPGV